MLRIPMTWVRERSSSRSPQGNRELLRVSLMPVSVFAGRTTDKPVITGLIFGVEIVIRGRCRRPGTTTVIVAPALGITHRLAGHDVVDLLQIDGLVFHQGLGHGIELVTVLFKQALGGAVAIIDDAPHFLVDHACRLGGDVGRLGTLTAPQEYLTFLLGVHQRTELLRQTPLGDHVAGQLGGTHDVVGGAGGDSVEAQGHFLGDTAAEQRADLAHQGALGQAVTVFFRQEHGHTQGAPTGNDGHLVDRVVLGHQTTDNGVTGLVVGGIELFFLGHDHGFALGTHHDLVLGQLEFGHFHHPLVGAGSKQGRLVDQVGQIGTGEPRGPAGNRRGHYIVTHRHPAHLHLENLFATTDIRQPHHYLTVEAAGAQQRRVQHVRAVGGGNDDDAVVGLEAVHFHQQLVEGLLALVVTAAEAGTTMAADGIDLVDEDDAGRMFLGLLEHVTHAAGTDTDEHLDEIGAGNGEEGHLGFAGNRLGQKGLAGTRLADHQYATGYVAAQTLELARVTQELHQLGDFFLGLVAAGDISEGGLDLVFGQHPRLALAEAHRPATATRPALHLAHEEHEDGDDDQDRETGDQQLGPDALTLGLLALDDHVVVQQIADQAVVLNGRPDSLEGLPVTALAGDHETVDGHPLDLAIVHQFEELGVVHRAGLGGGAEVVHHGHQHRGNDQPQDEVFRHVVQIAILLPRMMVGAWLYFVCLSDLFTLHQIPPWRQFQQCNALCHPESHSPLKPRPRR